MDVYTYQNNFTVQLDYIFIDKKSIYSALKYEACSSFEGVSYDHKIVLVKIRLSLRRNKTQRVKNSWYDWSSLANCDIRNKYMVTGRNNFDTLR